MKRILISLLLTSAAHAAPTPTTLAQAKAHVTSAKQSLASARAELKVAKAKERADRRAKAKARTIARAKARLAKLQATTSALAPSAITDAPDREEQCRSLARTGESWEDACDRVYGVETDPAGY